MRNGELVWSADYDIYGRLRNVKGERTFIPFRQVGQIEDSELEGLYYNRYRWYNSETGCYISQDPIGLAGGNPTLYGYVCDPNTQIDPFGLNEINDLGQIGEKNAGITKNTTRIPSASGKKVFRVPDGMSKNKRHITEVKNVNYQYLSSQLKDDLAYVNRDGKRGTVTLIVDKRTKLSKQLQVAIDTGQIKLKKKELNKTGCH